MARRIAEQLRARLDRKPFASPEVPPDRLRRDPHTLLDSLDLTQTLDYKAYEKQIDALRDRISDLHREAHARGVLPRPADGARGGVGGRRGGRAAQPSD